MRWSLGSALAGLGVLIGQRPDARTAVLAFAAIALVALAALAVRSAAAACAGAAAPALVRGRSLRRQAARTAYLRLRDPAAPGRPRPRAPSATP